MWETEQARFANHCNAKKLSPELVYKEAIATVPAPPRNSSAGIRASLKAKARVHPSMKQEESFVESDSGSSSSSSDEDDDIEEDNTGNDKNSKSSKRTMELELESFGSSFGTSLSPSPT